MHPEKNVLNIQRYKEELWNCIRPLLDVYGLDANELCIENAILSAVTQNQEFDK
jgi:hypothetical protein